MHQRTRHEQQTIDNRDWARLNLDLIQQHGGQVVAVCRQKVVGVGSTEKEASQNALSKLNCPPLEQITFVHLPLAAAQK